MAVSMDTFPNCTCFFSNALAGPVLYSRNYLKTCETKCFKSKPADESHCGSRNAFPFLTRPYPIAEVGKVMLSVDLIDGATAKKGIVFYIKNDEVIFNALCPHLVSGVKPKFTV